jgi:hypothetical protein
MQPGSRAYPTVNFGVNRWGNSQNKALHGAEHRSKIAPNETRIDDSRRISTRRKHKRIFLLCHDFAIAKQL